MAYPSLYVGHRRRYLRSIRLSISFHPDTTGAPGGGKSNVTGGTNNRTSLRHTTIVPYRAPAPIMMESGLRDFNFQGAPYLCFEEHEQLYPMWDLAMLALSWFTTDNCLADTGIAVTPTADQRTPRHKKGSCAHPPKKSSKVDCALGCVMYFMTRIIRDVGVMVLEGIRRVTERYQN